MADFDKSRPIPAAPMRSPRPASDRNRALLGGVGARLVLDSPTSDGVLVLCIGMLAIILLYGAHLASMI
jgi:hypothetical protein